MTARDAWLLNTYPQPGVTFIRPEIAALAQADALVLSSFAEGLPVVAMQAMAAR